MAHTLDAFVIRQPWMNNEGVDHTLKRASEAPRIRRPMQDVDEDKSSLSPPPPTEEALRVYS